MARSVRLLMLIAATVALVAAPPIPSADAGGSWLYPVDDRYEPGDLVTLVGYTGSGQYGSIDDGPFFGYLFLAMGENGPHPRAIPLPVGQLDVTRTGQGGSIAMRAAISFSLPNDVPAGTYIFHYCNDPCEEQLGHLIGGIFYVGVDPNYDVVRSWPSDEPEIQNLAADALISSFGSPSPAGELQPAD